jgi:hypothetical protein
VVNYANLLEENEYFEECFKIYERGLDLFSYPVAFELWNLYLQKAVDRRLGMERLRDLFEQAVEGCPPKFAKVLYLMYGALEEERGLARHAMRIYERATRAVGDEDRADMFNYYITKSASNFGLTSTRQIYERAIAALPDNEAKDMCLKFAEMERRLGEIDRARAIFAHASQFADPRVEGVFWKRWEEFEVQHGNEDTFKEMLRVKRSVVVLFKYVYLSPYPYPYTFLHPLLPPIPLPFIFSYDLDADIGIVRMSILSPPKHSQRAKKSQRMVVQPQRTEVIGRMLWLRSRDRRGHLLASYRLAQDLSEATNLDQQWWRGMRMRLIWGTCEYLARIRMVNDGKIEKTRSSAKANFYGPSHSCF